MQEWVECDLCHKWRQIPADTMPAGNEEWNCVMSPLVGSCDVPEEACENIGTTWLKLRMPCADLIAPGWYALRRQTTVEPKLTIEQRNEVFTTIAQMMQ